MTPETFIHFAAGCAGFLLGYAAPIIGMIWWLKRKEPTNG